MEFNPLWKQEFEQSRSSILQAAEGWIVDVQHAGSTAVTGGIARPIVDLVAGLSDLQQLNQVSMLVEGLNFKRIETPAWCEDELCAHLIKPRNAEETHSLLVVKHEGNLWNRASAIRNQLQNSTEDWERFKQLKLDNFQPSCSAAANYEIAKSQFFGDLEIKIASDS